MDLTSSFRSAGQEVLLGSKRNVLLVRDDVGKAKPTTRRLPSDQFTFGKPESKNCESAAQGKLIGLKLG
jgi:hypothetical protein